MNELRLRRERRNRRGHFVLGRRGCGYATQKAQRGAADAALAGDFVGTSAISGSERHGKLRISLGRGTARAVP